MENEEKRYTITKIDRIDNNISEAKRRVISASMFVGAESLTIAAFLVNSINANSPFGLISSVTLGALSIFSYAGLKREINDLKKLKELRAKIVDEESKEEIRKVK